MKRLDVLMPSRNSYSEVTLGWPSSMMTALAVVPPMSNTMVSLSPRARASSEPPTTPPAGPDATIRTGFSLAVAAATIPANRPVLYGDGHASERIAQVLVATIPTR